MATMIISDEPLRASNIEGDPDLARRILTLPLEHSIVLRIEGHPMRFRKTGKAMFDGVMPDPAYEEAWRVLQARKGATIAVEPDVGAVNPYLLSLTATLTEWNSPEDAAAYDGL